MKKVVIASDHAGFARKAFVKSELENMGIAVKDLGPESDERTDYPDWADQVCQSMLKDEQLTGVLICGSGQGMIMRANKYPHVRAALCWNEETAQLAREHNDANILAMGSRHTDETMTKKILQAFFNTDFAGGRHSLRVKKIGEPHS